MRRANILRDISTSNSNKLVWTSRKHLMYTHTFSLVYYTHRYDTTTCNINIYIYTYTFIYLNIIPLCYISKYDYKGIGR